MNKQDQNIASLDLVPRLKRPLSPWNPLDYLRLLYWTFFFPQALPWYLNTFGKPEYLNSENLKAIEVLRQDAVPRRLVFQALVVLLIAVPATALGFTLLGGAVNWYILVAGVVLGVVSGGIVGRFVGFPFGVAFGVAFGVIFGLGGSILLGTALDLVNSLQKVIAFGAALGTALGVGVGVALNVTGSVKSGVDEDVMKGVTGGVFFIIVGGFFFITTLIIPSIATSATAVILTRHLKSTAFFSIGMGTAFSLCLSRLLEYFPAIMVAAMGRGVRAGRFLFLPLPGVRKQLEKDLETDWEMGIHKANHILAYSLQYIPVIKAVNKALKRSHQDDLLSRISALVNQATDWDLIRFCSASLNKRFRQKAKDGFLFLFPWKRSGLVKPRTDTKARAACAGFWYWHQERSLEAREAFTKVQELHNGTELYYIASAIDKWFEIDKDDKYKDKIEGITAWEQETQRLKKLPGQGLRPDSLELLRTLQAVSKDIGAAHSALSSFKRSKITQNAILTLKGFDGPLPHPEGQLIRQIAQKWINILENTGWVFPDEELHRPVENPYEGSSGLPVTGPTFRGRDAIIKKIEEHWATDSKFSTLILYGQRRIGKTSILKSMAMRTESNIILVYISMQNIGKVSHTGQLLFRFAGTIYRTAMEKGLSIGAPPNEADYTDMGTGCVTFNRLLDRLAPHMTGQKRLVLAIDEFEVIQEKIDHNQIDGEFLPYLRDIVQNYSWLGMIFAGLHTIEEMGRDYQSAFYGQADYRRVSFLKKKDAFELIAHPKPPRIALEYSQDLLDQLYRLTAGQPYLIQCLCRELVFRWNERFEQEGDQTPRTFKLDDLPPLLTSDFFESAAYYFDGVWKSITENERTLIRIMEKREEGTWTLDELDKAAKPHPSLEKFSTLKETIDLLKRHDVILEEGGNVRFASELMRRWVAEEKSG